MLSKIIFYFLVWNQFFIYKIENFLLLQASDITNKVPTS